MPSCCVQGCSTRTGRKKGVTYIMARFPKDQKKANRWIENINNRNWTPTPNSYVCEIHFGNDMWEKQRVDGKRKLKSGAIPTIFHNRSKENKRCLNIDIDRNIVSIENSLNKDPLRPENKTENLQNKDLLMPEDETDDDDTCILIVSNSTHLKNTESDMVDEMDHLRKQLEETQAKLEEYKRKLQDMNRAITKANKLLIISERSKLELKKRCKRLAQKRVSANDHPQTLSVLQKVFTEDQIDALTCPSTRGHAWSKETIRKALRLKFSCGSSGYNELLKQNIPLPSERTLREKLEDTQLMEEICDD